MNINPKAIKRLMAAQLMTQEKLAKAAGVNRMTVNACSVVFL